MGIIKDRNGVDITEAENIKKRWQDYIFKEKSISKDLNDPDSQNGMRTHLEPYFL